MKKAEVWETDDPALWVGCFDGEVFYHKSLIYVLYTLSFRAGTQIKWHFDRETPDGPMKLIGFVE